MQGADERQRPKKMIARGSKKDKHRRMPVELDVTNQKWDQVQLFHSGDDYYAHLISDIRRAKNSVTIETYIFAVDKVTKIVLAELGQARKRGCRVQLLIDGFGSYYWLPELSKQCYEMGLDMRVYHPLPDTTNWLQKISSFYFLNLRAWHFLKKMNRRDHRKVTIIDEVTAYLGSLNFTQYHSESAMGKLAWRDTGVRVTGEPVMTLVRAFSTSWRRSHQRSLRRFWLRYKKDRTYEPAHCLVRLNSTPRKRFRLYRDLLRRIRHAEKRIYITTAYFLPRSSLLRALKNASERGVSVQLIVPGVTDIPPSRWAAFEVARSLLKSKAQLFEYQKRVLHAKYMIIDDYVAVGSLNLNHRSFLHDLEVEVVLPAAADIGNMLTQWEIDRAGSLRLTKARLGANAWWVRLLSRIAFKLRYML